MVMLGMSYRYGELDIYDDVYDGKVHKCMLVAPTIDTCATVAMISTSFQTTRHSARWRR